MLQLNELQPVLPLNREPFVPRPGKFVVPHQRSTVPSYNTVIRLGLAGCTGTGAELFQSLTAAPGIKLTAVHDAQAEALQDIAYSAGSSVATSLQYESLLQRQDLQAVVIATQGAKAFSQAQEAMKAGKHVFLVAQPCEMIAEIEHLEALAKRHHLTFFFAVQGLLGTQARRLRSCVQQCELGDWLSYDSHRTVSRPYGSQASLLPHALQDLALMDHILSARPVKISASGHDAHAVHLTCYFHGRHQSVAHLQLLAQTGEPQHRLTLSGTVRGIALADRSGSPAHNGRTSLPEASAQQELGAVEPLAPLWQKELRHFVDCIQQSNPPVCDGRMAIRLLRWYKAAQTSLRSQGSPIDI